MKKIVLLVVSVLATLILISCGDSAKAPVNTKPAPTGAEVSLDIYVNGAVYGEGSNTFVKVAADPVEIKYYDENDRISTLVSNYDTFLKDKKESWKGLSEKGASFTYTIKEAHTVGEEELALVKDYFVNEEEYGYSSDDIEEVVIFDVEAWLVVNGAVTPYSLNHIHPGKISEMPFVKVKGVWCYKAFLTADFIEELK